MSDTIAVSEEKIREGIDKCRIPEHLRDGLFHYLTQGRPVGSFLTSLLSNDLMDACARADAESGHAIYRIAMFLRIYAPEESWGSPRKVEAWLARGRARLEARHAAKAGGEA